MTPEEKQEIVAAVIAALKTNGKTIMQMTEVVSLQDNDYFEVSGARRVSYAYLYGALVDATTDIIDTYTTNVNTAIADKLSYYNASWIHQSSTYHTVANFEALKAAISAGKVVVIGDVIVGMSNIGANSISYWYYYDMAYYTGMITRSGSTITVDEETDTTLASNSSVTALGGRVTTAEGNITSLGTRMTNAETNITDLYGLKLTYYNASWVHQSSTYHTVENFEALMSAIQAGKVIIIGDTIVGMSNVGQNAIHYWYYVGQVYCEGVITRSGSTITVDEETETTLASNSQVTALGGRVTTLEGTVSGLTGSMGALNVGYLNEDDPQFSAITDVGHALDLVINRTKEVFCTKAEYDDMVDAGTIDEDTKYFIFEEE